MSSILGFADFNGVATIQQLKVTGGTADYILVDLTVQMTNPSNITITLGTINFNVVLNDKNSVIGKVYLKDLTITPGTQSYSVEMHLGEGATDQAAVSSVLSAYLTNQALPLTIVGSETSTDIEPLKTGLEQVVLASTMQGIQANLVTNVIADVDPNTGATATAEITIHNPLDTPFSILSVKAVTNTTLVCKGFNTDGQTVKVGDIDFKLDSPATIGAGETQTFQGWPVTNVDIMSAYPLLMDPFIKVSLYQTVVTQVNGAYTTGEMSYFEDNVPLTLLLGGTAPVPFPNMAYSDYTCQCGMDNIVPETSFTNQTTCVDGTPVVYRNNTVVTPENNAVNSTDLSNTTSTANVTTTTILPSTSVTLTSIIPTTTDGSIPTPTDVPATTTDATSEPTTTTTEDSEPTDTTETPQPTTTDGAPEATNDTAEAGNSSAE
jgi:hypothetical protein